MNKLLLTFSLSCFAVTLTACGGPETSAPQTDIQEEVLTGEEEYKCWRVYYYKSKRDLKCKRCVRNSCDKNRPPPVCKTTNPKNC